MSQKVIIGILCAVIALGGGAWYYQNQSESGDSPLAKLTDKSSSGSKEVAEEKGMLGELGDMISGSFSDLMEKGQSAYCTFDGIDPETGEPVEGFIYTSGENFSMEADTVIEGTALTMHIIQNDRVMYMWSDNEEVMPGMKIDMSMFPEDESMEQESPIAFLEDPESGVDYSCRAWIPKASAFEPPEDVEFFDMFGGMMGAFGAMMEGGLGEGGMMDDSGYENDDSYDNWDTNEQF